MSELPPILPNKTIVFGHVLDPSYVPIPMAKVVYCIVNKPTEISGIAVDKTYHFTYTDENGYFEIEFIPDLYVKITIPSTGRTVSGVIPYQGKIQFDKLQ